MTFDPCQMARTSLKSVWDRPLSKVKALAEISPSVVRLIMPVFVVMKGLHMDQTALFQMERVTSFSTLLSTTLL